MDLTASHTFDAPLDDVWAMVSDPASHVAKFESMGHREIEVLSEQRDDDSLHLVIQRVVDAELPGFAKRVLSPSNTVVSDDRWRRDADGASGEFTVDTKGVPVNGRGTTSLRTVDGGTKYEISVHVDVKVPLVGGRIADWSKGEIAEQFEAEFAAGEAWLAERR